MPKGTDRLFEAAAHGAASDVKAALEAGANPAALDDDGFSPFNYAKAGASAADSEALKGAGAYRMLKEGRFE